MYYCFTQIYGEGAMLANGNVMNNWGLGEMIYCSDLITITMKAALVVDTWTRFTYFALFGSIGIWFVLFPSYVKLGELITRNGHELTGLNNVIFLAPAYWLGILLVPIVANLRDYVWKV
jgi:phospholipid-transporting ATPase